MPAAAAQECTVDPHSVMFPKRHPDFDSDTLPPSSHDGLAEKTFWPTNTDYDVVVLGGKKVYPSGYFFCIFHFLKAWSSKGKTPRNVRFYFLGV